MEPDKSALHPTLEEFWGMSGVGTVLIESKLIRSLVYFLTKALSILQLIITEMHFYIKGIYGILADDFVQSDLL